MSGITMLTTITMITVLCGKINNYCTLKEPTYLLLSNISCNIYLHVHLPFFHQNWFQNSINVHTVNFRLWMGGRGGADKNTSWIYSLFKLPRFIIKNQIYLCFWLHVPLDGPITWGLISGGGGGEGRGHKSGYLQHYIHCFLIFICHTVYSAVIWL